MKLKYRIERDETAGKLVIQEYGELDKDIMAVLCDVSFEDKVITAAINEGVSALIAEIRSDSLYPPVSHIGKIAEQIVSMYGTDGKSSAELLFDDKEMLIKEQEEEELAALKADVDIDEEDEADELDDLLSDDVIDIKGKATKIKIADDDSVDIEDEG